MKKCQLCEKEFISTKALSNHLKSHKIDRKDYYLKYISNRKTCKVCNKDCKFININQGFRTYCGHLCRSLDPDYQEKFKQVCLEKYGSTSHFHNKEIKDKIKKTNLERFGVDNVLKSEEIRDRAKKTTILRYGVDHIAKSKTLRDKVSKKYYKILVETDRLKKMVTPLFTEEEYTNINKYYKFKCNTCDNIFEDNLSNGRIPICKVCRPDNFVSQREIEISMFCKQFYPNLIENDRSVLSNNKELDVYIPEINLAIEYDGLYWHGESRGNKSSNYHLIKTLECKEKGIQLIHIFEDEWINKQEIVKSILLNKIGKISNKIFARKCLIKKVNQNNAEVFLNNNHLQGSIDGKHYGLYHNNELVSILSIGKSRYNKNYDYEILRFCSEINTSVIGALSKLLKYINKELNPKSLMTYVDLRYGNGNGYIKNGFKEVNRSSPGYFYINHLTRENRLKFQKHKLKNLLETFDPNLTEWQNMQLNDWDRIWDCGQLVLEYTI